MEHVLTKLSWRELRVALDSEFVLRRVEKDPYDEFSEQFPGPSDDKTMSHDEVWRQMDKAIGRETPQNVRKMDLSTFQRELG